MILQVWDLTSLPLVPALLVNKLGKLVQYEHCDHHRYI